MLDNQITVTQEELEDIVYEEVQKTRHMLFQLCLEDYFFLPHTKTEKHKGKNNIIISHDEWQSHLQKLSETLGDLQLARQTIELMEPVYNAYHDLYEQEHIFNLNNYINNIYVSYSAEEFERIKDKFEEKFYKNFDDNELEH